MKVAVSIIKSKVNEKETVDLINKTSSDYIHIDIMDGVFVDNKSYDYEDIALFLKDNKKLIDIHLMVSNPLEYILEYVNLKPECISFHIETVNNPLKLIDLLHDNNIKCGIAINPETNIKSILPYLDKIDKVIVMTVHPGKGGQKFMKEIVSKIDDLNSIKDKVDELAKVEGKFLIEVDGGVNDESIKYLKNADIVVSGSYVCMSDNYEEKIQLLR